jgi:hypothetical protein
MRIIRAQCPRIVPTEFPLLTRRSRVNKQDAWKETGVHLDPMLQVKSEDPSM